jgi:hypothetical protein
VYGQLKTENNIYVFREEKFKLTFNQYVVSNLASSSLLLINFSDRLPADVKKRKSFFIALGKELFRQYPHCHVWDATHKQPWVSAFTYMSNSMRAVNLD